MSEVHGLACHDVRRAARARRRLLRLPAARRRLGLEQRRAGRRRRRSLLVDTLFDLRLTAADARRDGRSHSDGRRSARWSTPTPTATTATATSSSPTPRSSPRRRRPRRWREVPPSLLAGAQRRRRARSATCSGGSSASSIRRHRAASARRARSTAARSRRRRARGRADRGRSGAHRGRHARRTCPTPATIFTGDILFIGGTPIVWAGPLEQLDRGLRPDARHGRRDRRARPRPGHRQGRRARPCVTTSSFVDPEATSRHAAGLDAWEAAREIWRRDRRRRAILVAGLSSVASPSTSTPCTARSIPNHQPADIVERSAHGRARSGRLADVTVWRARRDRSLRPSWRRRSPRVAGCLPTCARRAPIRERRTAAKMNH